MLIHSLWQGLLLALAAAVVLMLTKKSKPALRYNLFCGLLIFFIVCNLITFSYELTHTDKSNTSKVTNILSSVTNNISASLHVEKHQVNFLEAVFQFIKPYENIIVFAWFLIIVFKCTYLVAGFKQIHALRNKQVSDAGEYWNNRVKEFAKRIGVKKTVILMRSALAKIPMVTGHLKPVILVPAVHVYSTAAG
jgi:beta-lactamase regulating signal transducer with metallopeptidase domain